MSGGRKRLRNCAWGYKCEKEWDDLLVTDKDKVRHCDACDQSVYLCESREALSAAVLQNRCVALDIALLKKRSGYEKSAGIDTGISFVGDINPIDRYTTTPE